MVWHVKPPDVNKQVNFEVNIIVEIWFDNKWSSYTRLFTGVILIEMKVMAINDIVTLPSVINLSPHKDYNF